MNAFWWSGSGFGIGFLGSVLNYVFKRCSEMWCIMVVWERFWDRVLRIRIELRDQNEVQKSTFFNGLESVLGSGFKAFVLNCVFKTWFKNGRSAARIAAESAAC